MTEDKTLDYHILKNLHYQNEYLHFIYRNTYKATMQQRKGNFWRIVEIPSILLALFNLFIIFFTNNWIIGGSFIFSTTLCGFIICYWAYKHYIKAENQRDEDLMNFNNILIWIQNSKDQVEIINKYNIDGMNAIKLSKIQEIEDLINDNLSGAFKKFKGQTTNYIENFLTELGLNPSRLRERLVRLKEFMEKNSKDYSKKTYFTRLNTIIQYLHALESKDDEINTTLQGLIEEDLQNV